MPKQVDHEERRKRIADAVCRLVARDGFEGVSLRHVAAEAGVSMGQVQHYFTTKDDMLAYTFESLSSQVEQRLRAAADDIGKHPPPARMLLRTVLRAMVPLDDASRAEAPLWIAYLARAVVRPELAKPLRLDDLTVFVADQIRSAQTAGDAPIDVDAEIEARSLLALTDGLMIRILLDPDSAPGAEAALDYHLNRLFRPRTHEG